MSSRAEYLDAYPELGGEWPFAPIEQAIADIREGRMVVVVDSPDRENEGDLVMAAQHVTPEAINFMATHGRGIICLSLTPERIEELGLEQMTRHNEAPLGTAFTVSIEAREGVTTGVSAADRAHTIQVAINPEAEPGDLVQPGHVFPLRARAVRRSRAHRPDRGVGRPRAAGGAQAGRRHLRDHERRRQHGPACPTWSGTAAAHGLTMITVADLIALPAPEREAGRAASRRRRCRPGTASSSHTATGR